MRLSGKNIIDKVPVGSSSIPSQFNEHEVSATLRDRGISVLYEKAYTCPCKAKNGTHLTTCKNCGGTGWVFANPSKTRFVITGIQHDSKFKEAALQEAGYMEMGVVKVTADEECKLSYMDRITIMSAVAEHSQLLYVADNEDQLFAYTKYDIIDIDYIALFDSIDNKLLKLSPGTDYTFHDNVILFTTAVEDSQITIRYTHHPVFHVMEILREAFTSYTGGNNVALNKIELPVMALAKRAHLIADVENFDGDRLFDNSWLPDTCETTTSAASEMSVFEKMVKYGNVVEIYNFMTPAQQAALNEYLSSS